MREKRRVKTLVKIITALAAVVFAMSLMAMDSANQIIPFTAGLLSGLWLLLFAWANEG